MTIFTHIALLSNNEGQIQGAGATPEAALEEAITNTSADASDFVVRPVTERMGSLLASGETPNRWTFDASGKLDLIDTAFRYTVFHPEAGDVYGRGLTVRAAAEEILRHDDRGFEVVPDAKYDGWWNLLRSPYSRSSGFKSDPTPLVGYFVKAASEDEAWDLFAQKVVNDSWYEMGRTSGLEAMTDERYDEYQREALGEDEDD